MIILTLSFKSDKDRSIFERIYNQHKDAMYDIALSIIGDKHLALDIVHDSFIKLFNSIDKIKELDADSEKAFLSLVVKNTAIDHYRKKNKINSVTESTDDSLYNIEDDFSVDKILAESELSSVIKKCLELLEPQEKLIIYLKYYEDYKNVDIGNITGLSVSNVSTKLNRIKKKLAKILKQEGVEEK